MAESSSHGLAHQEQVDEIRNMMFESGFYDRLHERRTVEPQLAIQFSRVPYKSAAFLRDLQDHCMAGPGVSAVDPRVTLYIDHDAMSRPGYKSPGQALSAAGFRVLSSICPSLPGANIIRPGRRVYPSIDLRREGEHVYMNVYSEGRTYRFRVAQEVMDQWDGMDAMRAAFTRSSAQGRRPETQSIPDDNYYAPLAADHFASNHSHAQPSAASVILPLEGLSLDDDKNPLAENVPAADSAVQCNDLAKACIVCMEHLKTILVVPCGHKSLCPKCTHRFIDNNINECPVCRSTIEKFVTVFDT